MAAASSEGSNRESQKTGGPNPACARDLEPESLRGAVVGITSRPARVAVARGFAPAIGAC